MRRIALALVIVLVGCGAPARVADPSPAQPSAVSADAATTAPMDLCPDGAAPVSQRFRSNMPYTGADGCRMPVPTAPPVFVQPPQVPTPAVALHPNAFAVGAQPALRHAAASEVPSYVLEGWTRDLMNRLDSFRGSGGRIGPVSDDEWNGFVWPGPFQNVVRAAVAAKPKAGRFFHLETASVGAAYALPWNGLQFIDVTISFRDHAEDPPAEGELWYRWQLRIPTSNGGGVFAIADGHDASARTFMRSDPYWSTAALEKEASSAVAGYLWNESYVPGGNQQFANVRDTTPFWHARIESLNRLNALFAAGTLTERRFDNVGVRIDRFDPLTYFGGGVVTATVTGHLVEVVNGKTVTETFSEPMKFFRFGSSGIGISGWSAVDAFQDGAWVSGGNLALDQLQTSHG